MKSKFFVIGVVIACLAVAFVIYLFVFGHPSHFNNAEKTEPKPGDLIGSVYTGGYLVAILLGLTLMVITFIIERLLSLTKAQGRGSLPRFIKRVQDHLMQGNVDAAIDECNKQRGSAANILRSGLERYQQVRNDSTYDTDKKLAEVKRAVDESTGLETPLLEKNLVALSTIASISTMIGLLGTTLGMIRAFQALAKAGQAASAVQLSVGISEALINTAGGLMAAILSIVAYNYFTNRVDNFVYMIEEATLSMMEILTVKTK
ncbi:MAG: MotA/TolQ/ExbB proton channel family protein [Candidatus Kapaibacterium sp.]